MRLDSVTPAAPRPLDEVRDAAAAGARAEAVARALMALAQDPERRTGGDRAPRPLPMPHALGPERYRGVTRLDRLPQIPGAMLESLMAGDAGTPVIQVADASVLLGLTGATQPADPEDARPSA